VRPLGQTTWAIPAGRIPPEGTGPEPEFTSRDELCLLNTGDRDAEVAITVFHTDRDPVGPYEVEVGGRRVRNVRINDLIDPEAVPLDRDYALVVVSSVPIVVEHVRVDSRRAESSMFGSIGYPAS
jgi:hypothetical protein